MLPLHANNTKTVHPAMLQKYPKMSVNVNELEFSMIQLLKKPSPEDLKIITCTNFGDQSDCRSTTLPNAMDE